MRRISNRKIDPTTNTIYHLEDNPPPEGDAKLKDRLQDYNGEPDQEPSRVSLNHKQYDQHSPELKRWAQSFGARDASIGQALSALVEVPIEGKAKREDVMEAVTR